MANRVGSQCVSEWKRPKRPGQVVRHYRTGRHGIVIRVEDMPAGQMSVCLPDTMQEETRRQTAFYETDIRCHPNRLYSLEDGHQGIWWEDEEGVPWYLMTEGISVIRPAPKPVRKSRTLRTATPGTRAG